MSDERGPGHVPHSLEFKTIYTQEGVFHYTCNAPKVEVLKKHHIEAVGAEFKCVDPREVLRIPAKWYVKYGYVRKEDELLRKKDLQIITESLLRRIS